jgi:hypothetical protein
VLARRDFRINEEQAFCRTEDFMDKKMKKKTNVLQQRIQALQQRLAGAKKQPDDQSELKSLEQQLAAAEAELAKIKES